MDRQTRSGLITGVIWVALPVVLAVVGYFLIGPLLIKTMPKSAPIATDGESTSSADPTPSVAKPEPLVDISSRKIEPKRRTTKYVPKPKPTEETTGSEGGTPPVVPSQGGNPEVPTGVGGGQTGADDGI